MKDITDYFNNSTENVNIKSPNQNTELSKEKCKNGSKLSPATTKSKKARNKSTPKSKNKISPRRSPLEGFKILFHAVLGKDDTNSKMETDYSPQSQEAKSLDIENSFETQVTLEKPSSDNTKLNAFQFLMMSRNKVIGSNSPGKELHEQEVTNTTSPPKLLARKRLLQNWSDSIKSKKRKLNDDDIDKIIKVKLNTRKKRLKSLLNIDDNAAKETENGEPTIKKQSPKTKEDKSLNGNPESSKKLQSTCLLDKTEKKDKDNPKTFNNTLNKSLSSGDDFEKLVENNVEISTPKASRNNRIKKNSNPTLKSSTSKSTWRMKIKLVDHDSNSSNIKRKDIEDDIICLEDNENSTRELSENEKKCQNESTNIIESKVTLKKVEEENTCSRILRSRTSLNKNKNIDYVYSSDESGDEVKKKGNKSFKVAPVFAKAIPKPKIDPEVLEARRKFLMSDMPDSLRKKIEKQTSNEVIEIEFDVFPKMSHVYQEEKNHHLWNLPDANLKLKADTSFSYEPSKLLCQSLIDNTAVKSSRYKESEPIKYIEMIIKKLKSRYTNYPVYKAFRLLKEKNGFKTEQVTKTTPRKGRKSRKSLEKKGDTSTNIDLQDNLKHLVWTEKYKPRSSEDFFGNIEAVLTMKKWLEKWKDVFERGRRKRKHCTSDSDSEFMSSDAESVYDRSLSTTIVLTGPCGSGKSSSVYAVCNELGLKVLELNASSRRTGKQVIQELQEATQSHQVRKNKTALDSFTKEGTGSKLTEDEGKNKSKKMCVLLIEDIDLVFDQDEGFINSITQISATSKRPIILTTTNEDSVYAQKFMNDFKTIRFHSFSVNNLGIWLQILCVLEGIYVEVSCIGELLEYNRGDLRKTILELQYWIQSGGQINKQKTFPIFELKILNDESSLSPISDDTQLISLKEYDEKFENYRVHSNILSDFQIFQIERFYNIPSNVDLKTLWWNIPTFVCPIKPKPQTISSKQSNKKNSKRLKVVSNMYDSVARFDVLYRKIELKCDDPICKKRWHSQLQDSLEVDEKSRTVSTNQDILELSHFLTDGYLNLCKKKFLYEFYENQRLCNMAIPGLNKARIVENDHKYEEKLLNPVPSFNSLDHKSVVLDYLPCLRTIARTENIRAKNNVKRHNRFHNYLQNLNITCDTPILDFAIKTFTTDAHPQ